jgi:hypothetical protein
METIESYVFYRSFHEAMAELDPAEYGALMYAINEYALNKNDKKVKALTGITKALWTLIKPQIDANHRRREIGFKGGRPAKNDTEKKPTVFENDKNKKPKVIFFDTEKKPNVNVNVNENLNEKDNVNVNGDTFTNTITDTPTLSLVREYIKSENLNIEAEKFYTYYQARNWQNVTNWRLALLKWNEKQFNAHAETSEKKSLKSASEVLAELEK